MSESECETTENSILIVDLIVGLSVSARTICSIMMDCQCITTTLIKVPQVGLMPITASRPYGCLQQGSCWLLAVLPSHSPQYYPASLFVFVSLWITCQLSAEIQDFHPAFSSFFITCDTVSEQSSIWDAIRSSLHCHSCSDVKREITLLRAADLWTTAREMSVLSPLYMLAMLGCSRFSVYFPENDGAFFTNLLESCRSFLQESDQ